MFKKIARVLKSLAPVTYKDLEYRYLSESYDNVDLERRMKEIQLGQAPYQRYQW